MVNSTASDGLKISLISLHGLIRASGPELGRDADTGGQVKYVLELASELSRHPDVSEVELLTRQIIDDKVGSDYAVLEEQIAEHAKLVRIPFGPRRYLRKEALWPYIEMFVDQALLHFKRHGLPDIIHGHYADAGYAGAQLARLLHVPYIFTGHSLGRVKRQRLLESKSPPKDMESKYHFTTRIEAEEFALETAAMVVTSTNQEVEEQYQLYDHYVPGRMEVIPPGVNLDSFHPHAEGEVDRPPIYNSLTPFLRDPDRPMILAMARPDERKNLSKLVEVYGLSNRLQNLANLVLVMGTRENLAELPRAQRDVILKVLSQVDQFDLYGKVAYPKSHSPVDIPDLYRLAASVGGVFVNPAMTEPFGLTLLEAAGSGVPIVATNDGGPRDIIANCQNGLLVDPFDGDSIERALLRTLTEPDEWKSWAANGIQGAREHYSWKTHSDRYLRDLRDILEHSPEPALKIRSKVRRLPDFDRLLITDLDNTLTGDEDALGELVERIQSAPHVGFGIATGRTLESALELIHDLDLPMPDLLDTDVGTQLHYGSDLNPDRSWRQQISYHWRPDEIRALLDELPGFFAQPDDQQSEFKISYEIDEQVAPKLTEVRRILREHGLRAKVVKSLNMYLDIIPVRGGSDLTMRHLVYKWGFSPEHVLVAGDSGNDEGMLKGRTLGVVVANYSPELEKLRNWPRIYFASQPHARGILEGIDYYQFFDNIVIPND